MGIFIYAFTATGKTFLSKKYQNVIDMETTLYKYKNTTYEDETKKGTKRECQNKWPENYFKKLEEVKDKYDYILLSDDICNDYLHKNNYEYWWVYPNEELKQEYIYRCKNRGNNSSFIEWYEKEWNEWINSCKNDLKATKHIELQTGQYLEDVLPNLIKK